MNIKNNYQVNDMINEYKNDKIPLSILKQRIIQENYKNTEIEIKLKKQTNTKQTKQKKHVNLEKSNKKNTKINNIKNNKPLKYIEQQNNIIDINDYISLNIIKNTLILENTPLIDVKKKLLKENKQKIE